MKSKRCTLCKHDLTLHRSGDEGCLYVYPRSHPEFGGAICGCAGRQRIKEDQR